MNTLIIVSLILNIAVLVPVCNGLITNADWSLVSYGEPSAARGILLSVYLTILIASALLLVFRDPKPVALLLSIQIVYKLLTPVTVGTFSNSVVISNVLIAAFHTITVIAIWRSIGNPFRG